MVQELAPVRAQIGRKANPLWEGSINAACSKREAFDSLPNDAHDRSCENEAAPHDADIYLSTGNTDPKFHNVRWQVFCTASQVLHVLDLELTHGMDSAMAQRHFPFDDPRQRLFGQPGDPDTECARGSISAAPHASLFYQTVFANFHIFI